MIDVKSTDYKIKALPTTLQVLSDNYDISRADWRETKTQIIMRETETFYQILKDRKIPYKTEYSETSFLIIVEKYA